MIAVLVGIGFLGFLYLVQRQMKSSFKAMTFDVFEQNAKSFLQLAEEKLGKYREGAKADLEGKQKEIAALLEPVKGALKELSEQSREIEKRREGAYAGLHKQLEHMMLSDNELRRETAQLTRALRSPNIRGSWGQVHLRRVVELAGLVNQCDFAEQVSVENKRPDLVVNLPGARQIVVDAKTPINAYLEASEMQDEERVRVKLQEHALALRKHIKDLSSKEYWKSFNLSPEYVILFLPAEAFFSSALQIDPTLIEVGADQNVIVATPTTLIAILRAVAFSWKQENLSKSAAEIAKLGSDLYDRLGIVCEHWGKVGRQLGLAVDSYNQSISSLESRVFVSARKLKESTGAMKELPEPEPIDKLTRTI
jgi:DNA recombination protein RmuC